MQGNGAGARWIDEHRKFREVTLTSPIFDSGQEVRTIRVRQPCVIDLEEISSTSYEKPILFLREVLAACSGLSTTAIKCLTIEDFVLCAGALSEMGFRLEQAWGLLTSQMESALATGRIGSLSLLPDSDSGSETSG